MFRRRGQGNPSTPPDRAALTAERVRVAARLREIDRLLAPQGRERAVRVPPETR